MNQFLFYFLPILLLCSWSVFVTKFWVSPPSNTPGVNHIQLVEEWIPTFCKYEPCIYKPKPRVDFTLHGLWPADAAGRLIDIRICTGSATQKQLRSAYKRVGEALHDAWPNIRSKWTEEDFWDYEWSQHGKCSNMEPYDYFRSAPRETKNIKLLKALISADIQPDNVKQYPFDKVEKAIKQSFGGGSFDIYISCLPDRPIYLKEIYICLDTSATTYVSCPRSSARKFCGANVIIPVT